MIHYTHLQMGSVYGILYRFPRAGDGIPLHTHTAETEHRVLCTRGRIRITVNAKGGREVHDLRAGAVLDTFDSRAPHEIMALEDHSSCFNAYTHGRPPGYATLPAAELDGSTETMPLTFPLRCGVTHD